MAHDSGVCGDDVAAYALGALEPAELESFRTHLETCAICRDELAAFDHVVNVLGEAAPAYRAPATLRRDLMAAVRAEPKGEKRVAPASAPPRPARRPLAGAWGWRGGLGFAGAIVAAIAVLVAVRGSGTPSTRIVTAQVMGVSGRAQLRVTDGHGELVVRGLSAPPAGEIYEVWLKRPGRAPIPAGSLFSVNRGGAGDADVPGSLHGVSTVMVTTEPAGGSSRPTTPPVIQAQLT